MVMVGGLFCFVSGWVRHRYNNLGEILNHFVRNGDSWHGKVSYIPTNDSGRSHWIGRRKGRKLRDKKLQVSQINKRKTFRKVNPNPIVKLERWVGTKDL